MHILMIWPAIYMGFDIMGKGFEQSAINHGLASISALLKSKGHTIELIDLRACLSWEHYEQKISFNKKYDLCLIGFYSVDSSSANKSLQIFRRNHPNTPIIAGGVHITFNQLESFSVADCLVWGEGESVILELVEKVGRKERLPNKVIAPIVKDLDSLPYVDRGLFDIKQEQDHPLLPLLPTPNHTINFSRGCTNRCSFCLESKNILFRGYRTRSPEKCIDELAQLAPLGSLMIHDDLFPPGKWCEQFIYLWNKNFPRVPFWCQMRADQIVLHPDHIEALAAIGMTWVSLGIEGSERMREFYNKKVSTDQIIRASEILHDNGVNIFANYIVCSPTETENDLKELEEIIAKIKPEWHSQSPYTAYPGSKLYDYCIEHNLFVGDGTKDSDYYSLSRYPYHRKVKGVDYDRIANYWGPKMMAHKSEMRQYKKPSRKYKPMGGSKEKEIKIEELEFSNISRKKMDKKPKVSIIMTSYNRPQYLFEAIQSVLNQTMKDWELIIVDDCSTNPQVMGVIKKAIADPRIRAFSVNYDVNNISVEWNLGIEQARGEYIALLDDDNRKLPDFCLKMSEYLDTNPDKDAVACFMKMIDKEGDPTGQIFDSPTQMTKENILERNFVDSGSMMWRREIMDRIGWFDERLKTTEDWDFVIRLMYESKGFGVIQLPLVEYRWHGENRSFVARGLGLDMHKQFISKIKPYNMPKTVTLFHQDLDKITLSQQNVFWGIADALEDMNGIIVKRADVSNVNKVGRSDYIIVFAPFSIPVEALAKIKPMAREVMFFHCEDPQAIVANLERAKYADFISSNDRAAIPLLETVVGRGNVAYCPSISFNDLKLKTRNNVEPKYDLTFVGYPYESRKKFIKDLFKRLKFLDLKICLIGDGWDKFIQEDVDCTMDWGSKDLAILPTVQEQSTLKVMEESKIVLLYNRRHTDCGGCESAIKPLSVVRGYFECASGSYIMLDNSRAHHCLYNLLFLYNDVNDAVKTIRLLTDLHNMPENEVVKINAKKSALEKFTYRVRIKQLFDIFRNRRFYQEIS